jgi:exodeoxyribonuclease V alpha subunit
VTRAPRELLALGVLAPLDVALAEALTSIAGLEGDAARAPALGAAFASHAVLDGHACVELAELSRRAFVDDAGQPLVLALPDAASFERALRESPLVDGDTAGDAAQGRAVRPLVLDGRGRLYLRRYYEYEARLAAALVALARSVPPAVNGALLQEGLGRLFPGANGDDLQRRAAALAVLSRLTVVSGGPGTGKTYTVSKILALLVEQALERDREPKIALLAPTGKAAQRLGDAIRDNVRALDAPERVKALIPAETMTIHRKLRFQPATPTRFAHGRGNPLPDDIVIVDEASMVDLALMTKLTEALGPEARLVLLGDKDQLASVEAGAILSELYATRGQGFSAPFVARARELAGAELPAATSGVTPSPLADHLVELVRAHRFEDGGGIAELAHAVNAGDADAAIACFARHPHVRWEPLSEPSGLRTALAPRVVERFAQLAEGSPLERLGALDSFRVLACHVRGPLGVRALNEWIAAELAAGGKLDRRAAFYAGRPVIVTANDYASELFNGDVGVVAPRLEDPAGKLAVHFRTREAGGVRSVALSRLPEHETAYALSVHKSQGSEFAEVALVLPSRPSPLLTRELIYTAVTRARRRVTVYGSEAVLRTAIERKIERASGLRDRLLTG